MKFCSACGTALENNAAFCPSCGKAADGAFSGVGGSSTATPAPAAAPTPAPAAAPAASTDSLFGNFCGACGTSLPGGAVTCPSCGAPVGGSPVSAPAAAPVAAPAASTDSLFGNFCGACGTSLPGGAVTCPSCGAPVGGAPVGGAPVGGAPVSAPAAAPVAAPTASTDSLFGNFCGACGTSLPGGAVTCPSCGAPVGGAPVGGAPVGGVPAGGSPVSSNKGGNMAWEVPSVSYTAPVPSRKNRVFGTLSKVFGILGLCTFFVPGFGLLSSLAGMIFSFIGKRGGAGRVCGIIGTVLGFGVLLAIANGSIDL